MAAVVFHIDNVYYPIDTVKIITLNATTKKAAIQLSTPGEAVIVFDYDTFKAQFDALVASGDIKVINATRK